MPSDRPSAQSPEQTSTRQLDQAPTHGATWHLGHRPSLDALRGIAILAVLLGHFGVPGLPGAGNGGVTLFFALSGYLITGILLQGPSLRGFYIRRARRLLPALLVLLIGVGIWSAWDGRLGDFIDDARFVVFYVANWALLWGQPLVGLAHTWSLAVEEQFYIVWPLALMLALRRSADTAIALATLCIAASFVSAAIDPGRAFVASDARAKDLLLGAMIALGSYRLRRDLTVGPVTACLAALCVVLAGTTADQHVAILCRLPCAVLVAYFAARPNLMAWRPLTLTGRVSYGLYLYHYPFTVNATSAFHGFDGLGLARIPALLASSYAMAVASWYGIERRFVVRSVEAPTLAPHSSGTEATIATPSDGERAAYAEA